MADVGDKVGVFLVAALVVLTVAGGAFAVGYLIGKIIL